MSDDLERRLDDLYRRAREGAAPVRARWNRAPRHIPRVLAWASVAAAAVLLLLIPLLGRKAPAPAAPVVVETPAPPPEPLPPAPPLPPKVKLPDNAAPPPIPAPPQAPIPAVTEPKPEAAPVPEPERKPEPKQEPAPETPRPSRIERATVLLKEVDGPADLAGRAIKGTMKDVVVADGDRLAAQGVVRLVLGVDRYVLLAPRSQALFRPSKERLTLVLEQGELVAELNAPGMELVVVTKTCEIRHLGTVFSVKAEEKRTLVLVEEGRVEVRSAKGVATARAGHGVLAADGAAPLAQPAGELRLPAWARIHRPLERVLFGEDFTAPGEWQAQVENGVAKSQSLPGATGSFIRFDVHKPLFETPARGQLQIVYRADRAGRLKIQTWSAEHRVNFKAELNLLKTPGWKTLTLDLADLQCVDPSKMSGGPPPGTPFYYFLLMFDEDGDRGTLWVDSIRVISQR